MNIQWYPGHMTKTRRMIAEQLKNVDAVCEILDARIPISSRNPDVDELTAGKPRLVVLNRVDQADPASTRRWADFFRARGYAVLETNASMGLIVAAPTAGSAGIVPGLLLALQDVYGYSDEAMIQVLYNAGAIGYLAMRNATVAGAVGGCQAEVGIASAMASSAAVELLGGTPEQCLNAASTVLMNMLGLVCDPVGGLVEYPCQNRNAAGVANALIAAEMSLSGIPQLIPFDEMLDTMYAVGRRLPAELRETALGGCATAPSACARCSHH